MRYPKHSLEFAFQSGSPVGNGANRATR